jgi:hypothetical protein
MFQEKKMLNTITRANIVKKFEHSIFTEDKLLKFLELGDLSGFETTLLEVFHEFYNNIVEFYLNEISNNVSFCHRLKTIARSHGLKKLVLLKFLWSNKI